MADDITPGTGADDAAEVDLDTGQKLLTAVERLVEAPELILEKVEKARARTGAWDDPDTVAPALISSYSTKAAIIGGATAIPAMLPGLGTAATLALGPFVDMVMLLKIEAELCLALSALRGHDIRDPAERQLAFLLAAVNTAEVAKGRSALRDAVDVSGTAIWNYAPRRVGKLLVHAIAILAALHLSRNLLRAIPIIGVAVGASMNKVLTKRVGTKAYAALRVRDSLQARTS